MDLGIMMSKEYSNFQAADPSPAVVDLGLGARRKAEKGAL